MFSHEKVWSACCKTLLLLILFCSVGISQDLRAEEVRFPADSVFQLKTFEDENGTHKYALFLPSGYTSEKKWPVVLFLHGAGERGNDGVNPTRIGLGAALQERPEQYPFIAVFPQVEDMEGRYLEGWLADSPDGIKAIKILDEVVSHYAVDPDQQILTGWSMGGYGVWSLATQSPDRWSAVMPLSGGGKPEWASVLAETPIWNFHGLKDLVVLPDESKKMEASFEKLSREHQTHFSYIVEGGHDIWRNVFGYRGVVKWMLDPVPGNRIDMTQAEPIVKPIPAPFVPALELRRAAKVRVGNEALEMLSYAIPSRIPPSMLSGQLQDIRTSTSVEGRDFNVHFSNVSYQAELYRTVLETTPENLLSFKLGFERIDLMLGRGAVRGSLRSADTGPVRVQLGVREPVWLDIQVEPYVESGKIKLRNKGAVLILEQSNMQVTPPAGVSVDGLGMTRERVSRGLVNGLYNSRSRIQQEIQQVAPRIIRELERGLDLNEIVKDRSSIWPLPVHAPRIELQPESISVDGTGFEMTLNLLVASFTERGAPETPQVIENEIELEVNRGGALNVAVATKILTESMRLLIEEGLAHIDVEDIPGTDFDHWADRALWQELFEKNGQSIPPGPFRVLLTLNEPLDLDSQIDSTLDPETIKPESAEGQRIEVLSASEGRLLLPDVRFTLSTRNPARFSQRWKPFSSLRLDLSQKFALSLSQTNYSLREIRVGFTEPMQVQVIPLEVNGTPASQVNIERATEEFQQSMELWLKKATDQAMVLPDLDMQRSGLRASRLLLKKGQLVVDFDIPVVRIVNNTEEPQTYQTKGPYSDWSTNWVLKPGKAHHFTVPFPMLYRRSEGGIEELYTLPLGADVEFRWDAENTSEKPVARLFLKSSRPKSEESNSQDQFSTSAVE